MNNRPQQVFYPVAVDALGKRVHNVVEIVPPLHDHDTVFVWEPACNHLGVPVQENYELASKIHNGRLGFVMDFHRSNQCEVIDCAVTLLHFWLRREPKWLRSTAVRYPLALGWLIHQEVGKRASMPTVSVVDLFATSDIHVTDALVYHPFDGCRDRYRYFVTRGSQRSRNRSEGVWVGTPELSQSDDAWLLTIATTNGLINRNTKNYHPIKEDQRSQLRVAQTTRYQPFEKEFVKVISQNERAYGKKRAAALARGEHMPTFAKRHHTVDCAVNCAVPLCAKQENCLRSFNHPGRCKVRPPDVKVGGESDSEDETPLSARLAALQPAPGFDVKNWEDLAVGQAVWALDCDGFWLHANLTSIWLVDRSVRVHYIGWNSRFDETLTADSKRVRLSMEPLPAPPPVEEQPSKKRRGYRFDLNYPSSDEEEEEEKEEKSVACDFSTPPAARSMRSMEAASALVQYSGAAAADDVDDDVDDDECDE